jgi:3-mercaptopyruvate sulfurtransferase SseA
MSKRKHRKQKQNRSSWVIPIIAGVIVVAIIIGAIASIEGRPPSSAAGPGGATALPQATLAIPYPIVPRVSVQEAKDKMDSGQAVLIDVRSKASYDASHAVGAISIPEEEIRSRLGELPREQEIILYCT